MIVVLLTPLALVSVAHRMGQSVPLASLDRELSKARCVSSDSPALLILTSLMRRDLDAGCPIVLDPTGVTYDTDRGEGRLQAPGYQRAMVEWYTSGDAALFAHEATNGLTSDTLAAIKQRFPVERSSGTVVARLPAPP